MTLSLKDWQSEAGVAKWIAEIGCASAPIPKQNIRVTLAFFDSQMPRLPIRDAVAFLSAMDLSRPVSRVTLHAGERLIGFRTQAESPFKLFFARRGAAAQTSGINDVGRGAVHFVARSPAPALESFTTGAIDTWTARRPGQSVTPAPRAKKWYGKEFGVMAAGGGRQLIIPESYSHLLVEENPGRNDRIVR